MAEDGGVADARAREQALVGEALRLCDRYVDEVVLAFGLCPWAEGVLRAGAVARQVLSAPNPSPADCLAIIDEWAADDGGGPGTAGRGDAVLETEVRAVPIDIGFVILPRREGSRAAFDSFAEAVRRADRARRPPDEPVPFMIAVFHPEGARTFTGPHQLVSFLRRTPDPLLQLVRAARLDRARAAAPEVSEQIAARNFAVLGDAAAAARFDAVVRDIRADRDATYARLGWLGQPAAM